MVTVTMPRMDVFSAVAIVITTSEKRAFIFVYVSMLATGSACQFVSKIVTLK